MIKTILEQKPLILDTETTGLDHTAEIIEIGIINHKGETIFESLVIPKGNIPEQAYKVHGINKQKLRQESAPTWDWIYSNVMNAMKDQKVLIYNAEYDTRLIQQTNALYQLPNINYEPIDAMFLYSQYNGAWDKGRG